MDAHNTQTTKTDEVPESAKYFTFFNVALTMSVILFAEIVLIKFTGTDGIVPAILYGLLAVKFTILLIWFMHLRWEKGLVTIVFLLGLVTAVATVFAIMAILFHQPSIATYQP